MPVAPRHPTSGSGPPSRDVSHLAGPAENHPSAGEAEQQVLTGLANPQNCLGDTNMVGGRAEAARLWGILEPSRAWRPIPGQVGKAFVIPSLLWV